MKMHLWHYDLPLRHPFTISRESITEQPTLIVELEEDGKHGFGEATTNAYYGVTIESMAAAIERCRPQIEGFDWSEGTPESLWDALAPTLGRCPFAQCAVDQAAHDLWGKLLEKPVYELWGLGTDQVPVSNYTIGIDTVDVMIDKLREFADWPVFKIKLGTDRDREIIEALRKETEARFRVDANCGWCAEDVVDLAHFLADHGVEFIEQPLPADAWEPMKSIYRESPLPLIADESCREEPDVACCNGFFHGINIKLVKCGGLTPARRMIDAARQRQMRVMVGCMTESTVGISAIAQLLPLLDDVDMDGAVLLAEDIADGVVVDRGRCRYPDRPGCGVELTRSGRRVA